METNNKIYQCAIVGGGLAGLCLAIQLADKGISVILFEKNKYPFHKVCGEYISMESWNFLTELGLPLAELNLPKINELGISSENGFMLNAELPLGGFGISRYSLDNYLYELAKKKNVIILDNCKVFDVKIEEEISRINTSLGNFNAEIVCGTYGKYRPTFIKDEEIKKQNKLNYIGVKYHIKTKLNANRIELHNFKDGYCGVSKVDNETYCLCYLSSSKNLQDCGNDIKKMEETILHKNPFLKKYFTESEFLFDTPLVISNVTFQKKDTYKNSFFLAGDGAGSITPLCGNGMSMAMRASKLLANLLDDYFKKTISKQELIKQYDLIWNKNFKSRIKMGYYLQYLFGKRHTTHFTLKVLNKLPSLMKKIISLTHGKPFLMKKYFLSIIFISLSLFGIAQNQLWQVVSSNITFKIKNAGFTVNGKFSGLSATIQFDATKNIGNKIDASIDANTINTDNSARDIHLKKEEYFSVEKFPKISMSAFSVTKESNGKYKGFFTLTIKGVSKIVPVTFTFIETNGKAEFTGSFPINRLDFQVGSSSLILSDNATINMEVNCAKK